MVTVEPSLAGVAAAGVVPLGAGAGVPAFEAAGFPTTVAEAAAVDAATSAHQPKRHAARRGGGCCVWGRTPAA